MLAFSLMVVVVVLCRRFIPVLMAKSNRYTNITATTIIVTRTPLDSLSAPKSPKNPPTISRTHARARRDTIVAAVPAAMNGTRFPHFDRQLSLNMPMYGCTKVPLNGPAIQTSAISDLLSPKDSKYGVPFDSSTAHASCKPPILIVRSIIYQTLFDSVKEW